MHPLFSVTGEDLVQVTFKEKERVTLPTPGMWWSQADWFGLTATAIPFTRCAGKCRCTSPLFFVHLSAQKGLLAFI